MGKNKPFIPLKNESNSALFSNSILDSLYRGRLHELAMARFKWENLPPEIDERFLEMTLNEYAMGAFFFDEVAQRYVFLPAMINGDYNIYNDPIQYRVWAINGYQQELTMENSIIVYNNMIKSPTFPWLDYYAEQLYDIDQARRVNILAQKTPVLFKGTDKQRLTLKNIWLKYAGNEPFMMVDESVDKDSFTVLKTDAPWLGEELTQMRRHIMGEIMIYLGYETQEATQKSERVLAGEVRAAQSESMSYRYSPLLMRRQAAEKINNMFGLNIEVNFRQPTSTLVDMDDPFTQYQMETLKSTQSFTTEPFNVEKEGEGNE